jgi:hypothetical protein
MIEIKKTDKRHTGSDHFKYCVNVKRNPKNWASMGIQNVYLSRKLLIEEYDELRRWCVDTWGMSCDRTHYLELKSHDSQILNSHWAWHTEYNELKIYLVSDKEVNWFKLRWS